LIEADVVEDSEAEEEAGEGEVGGCCCSTTT
jgi:hypothetical protein